VNDSDFLKQQQANEHAKQRNPRRYAMVEDEGQCDLCPRIGTLVEGLCSACRSKYHIKDPK